MSTPANLMSVRVWGWLLASCFIVLIGCCILTVNAHITLNEYQVTRSQDIAMMRQEIVTTSLAQSDSFRMQINNGNEQLKQYIDVQVPLKARDAIYSVSPININQTASPAITASPIIRQ
ncbi:hypothetical protein [Pseudomonas viridiflava]|uniref:hypothetical protein n=1 Tax=Pseudomonas viridiflava TaxID=33069 RepID=UPI001FD072E3|nr:hypothetical protein [Pseudomonas viridiflava]